MLNIKVLNNLSKVEDFLDCLENHGIVGELTIVGNSSFIVRWRNQTGE